MDKDALRSVFSDASRNGWSLRSDVQLQEWLEAFAEQLKRRTKEVAAEVHRLGTETGNVELLLLNNFNSLRALSATQFIENRVDEVDEEVLVNKSEQPTKQSRIESYDAQIVPRYKEAVLTAWDAFQGFSSRKSSQEFSDVRSRTHQALPTKPSMKLPHIIGTEEFMRDDHCGFADMKFSEVNARAPSSGPVESGSDTDRDEARMAADMVGERPWLDGEWFASGSETSEHQGGVFEPAVSAALDFKAMLEAALRGPSFPYDGGIMSNLENELEQQNVDNPTIPDSRDTESKSPSSLAGQDPVQQQRLELHEGSLTRKHEGSLTTKHEETPVEHNMQHQSQGFASEFLEQLSRTVLMQPPPITTPLAFNRNDSAPVTGSIGAARSPSPPTPPRALDDPDSSTGTSFKSDSPRITAKIQPSLERPPPATEFRSDDIPTPTLPEGLFQGLQEAIQARQLKSRRADEAAESTASEKPSVVSRSPPPLKLDLNRSFISKSKVETSSRLQKGVSAVKRTQTPITFQGGLFDDDDLDDMSESLSKQGTTTATTTPEIQSSPLTSRSSMVRKGLFDDFGDESGASSGGLEDRGNVSTQQSTALSLPERTESNRSRVLKKSLFGDSDEEDNNPFDE